MKVLRLLPLFTLVVLSCWFTVLAAVEKRAVDEKKASLADDTRLGRVVDSQGIASVKPVLHERWTPACAGLVIKPGDWLRTDIRGANALQVRLVNQAGFILGPGSLVEVVDRNELRVISGELEVQVPAEQKIVVHGPGNQTKTIATTTIFRVQKEKLTELAKEPKWLLGFKGTIVNETLGSLVAKVEGRDVPLTVGYHKVTVDIRDQIARTTIEESFVNHTDGTLEGVFYFPLPADASISGFGMWIGDQLVEADVVEKQRAREIYETILRERRDPGLLEWADGNLFKARVFPIFPHSEKRIKLTYTQVLPLRGSSYRYSYALQSEMLKQNPLRELKIDVRLHSTMPLKDVSSPTHTVRKNQTAHSAQLEFAAQEYTPERDFEVVVEVERQGQEVVFVPHQRGEDGYFLMFVNPPGGGDWQREVLPNGEPLELLILADTSGSMDRSLRKTQEAFVASVLSSLGPKDTFNLATCDVDCRWYADEIQRADEKSINGAREFLAGRTSLGWTDLEKAFGSVMERVGEKTQVIYVGDGIATTANADPSEFARRLKQMYGGKGTFHAVTPGSTYESTVLNTIASLGGGSVRRIAADSDAKGAGSPANVARQLLSEMAQPALRDLKVEFQGLQTARVYPEQLPNLASGSQQIVIGRYLPPAEVSETGGEVIVTGMQNGKPVRFRTTVSLAEAAQQAEHAKSEHFVDEQSFIPRLWARMHLDFLLQQGQTQTIQDEIIALSEEYQIMTPYTSFLVLESDADRERFKVKRRFQMRDGEKFFAKGRDTVNYELAQQQMKRAGTWRLNLQRQILRQFATLARFPIIFQPQHLRYPGLAGRPMSGPWGVSGSDRSGGFGGGYGEFAAYQNESAMLGRLSSMDGDFDALAQLGDKLATRYSLDDLMPAEKKSESVDELEVLATEEGRRDRAENEQLAQETAAEWIDEADAQDAELAAEPAAAASQPYNRAHKLMGESLRLADFNGRWLEGPSASLSVLGGIRGGRDKFAGKPYYPHYQPHGLHWLNSLLPALPAAPAAEQPLPPQQAWSADARALAESLLRRDELAKLEGGVELSIDTESFDVRRKTTSYRSYERNLIAPQQWIHRHWSDNSATVVQWCDEKERAIVNLAYELGRIRDSSPADLKGYPVSLPDFSFSSLERTYAGYRVEIEKQGDDRSLIKLHQRGNPRYESHFLIDTKRNVLVRTIAFDQSKRTSTTTFSDFVEVAGSWWATRIETTDEKDRRTSVTKVSVKEVAKDELAAEYNRRLPQRDALLLAKDPLPTVRETKQAIADQKADFNHHLAMLSHFAATQQWDDVKKHLELFQKLAGDKPGRRWVEMAVLMMSRRHEELRQHVLAESKKLAELASAGKSDNNTYAIATQLLSWASSVLQGNELLALLDQLRPTYDRLPEYLQGEKLWQQQRLSYLQQTGQADEAFALLAELAKQHRYDYSLQTQYANHLAGRGEYEAAYKWLDALLVDAEAEWHTYESESLRSTYMQLLENEARIDALVRFLAEWVKLNPESQTPYQQYLSALQRDGQEEKVDELVRRWLAEGRDAARKLEQERKAAVEAGKSKDQPHDTLPPAVSARLQAAVYYAAGMGPPYWTSRVEQKWIEPIAEAVRAIARLPELQHLANMVMQHGEFRSTDAAKKLRQEFLNVLLEEAATLPHELLNQIVTWISQNDPIVEKAHWQALADTLVKRWAKEVDVGVRRSLAATLVAIYSHIGPEPLLAFLERQLKEEPPEDHASHVQQLFDTLLVQPWKQEYEDRAYELLADIGKQPKQPGEDEVQRRLQELLAKLGALHRLNDRMVQARYEAAMNAIEHQEKLTRTELAAKRKEARKQAREAISDRLRGDRERYGETLAPWMVVERTYLDVQLERKLDEAAAEAWEYLGAKPKQINEEDLFAALDHLVRTRHLTTLAYLATRKNAPQELIDRLLAYYDAGASMESEKRYWQVQKFRLFAALDRPQQLEKELRGWIDPKQVADNAWRIALGYLLAEQARFDEAITLFEDVKKADELSATEYRALAGWYMAVNQREKHEAAAMAAYLAEGEQVLNYRLQHMMQPWNRGDDQIPDEPDPELLKVFAALFRKSEHPQNYIHYLQRVYQYSRDFRLLESVTDGVIGHSALRIYPLLGGMHNLLTDVREEATVDEIIAHLVDVRKQVRTDVDRRAVDLLEFVVERRAAELQNQAGPHVTAAVKAIRRATKGEWADGERRLMADLLANLGVIAAKELAAEQLRVLAALHAEEKRGTFDRLYIAKRLANTRWGYNQHAQAIDLLEAALAEFRVASGGVLPQSANDALSTFVTYLQGRGYYERGERVYLAEIKTAPNAQQRHWLTQQLYNLYHSTIVHGARVSLGQGAALYQAVEKQLRQALDTPDQNHRYELIRLLARIYRAGKDKNFGTVTADLRDFAFRQLPGVMKRQTVNYQSIISTVASTLHDVASARDGLAFLIERIENEPSYLRYQGQDGWSQHAWSLGEWRRELGGGVGDLEPRLLKLVLDELRRDLHSRQARNRNIYTKHNNHFWAEKEADFARVTEEVLEKNMQSSGTIAYIAEYLYHGLDRYGRAIEILLAAHERKVLDEAAQGQLVNFLHGQQRFAESIPILLPLVERRPENMTFRVQLMHAYFKTGQRDRLLALLDATDTYFHEHKLWNEGNIAALAHSTLENQLYERSVAYYKEVIGLHERTAPNRGIGNGTLSQYYMYLSQAWAGLKNTVEAVDAAGAAIVAWGPAHHNRRDALHTLKNVIAAAPDLDGYVKTLDQQVAESGLENPIVRKAVGTVYYDRGEYAKAIAQLEKAIEVQPNDAETHTTLIAAYDNAGDKRGAIAQLVEAVELRRREIALYKDLGERYQALGEADAAERAYTTIVEVLPTESESHALLADLRQNQGRWDAAAEHWARVAEIRKLEPTGLLKLAEAQINLKRIDDARDTIRKLEKRDWPTRFGDVQSQVRQLENRVAQAARS